MANDDHLGILNQGGGGMESKGMMMLSFRRSLTVRSQTNASISMKQKFTASICEEDEWFVAQCVEVDVASQGKTEDEAFENLRDALELHFTPPVATVAPQIRSLET
jgi:hypothetical protein